MRKITFISLALLGLALLTACSPASAQERDACSQAGGVMKEERFVYSSGGFFGDKKTGRVTYCDEDGFITKVYNEEITELKDGFFGTNENNRTIFNECSTIEGRTYKTSFSSGKVTHTRYVCIQGGEYVRILD